jgi:hypothetical protein
MDDRPAPADWVQQPQDLQKLNARTFADNAHPVITGKDVARMSRQPSVTPQALRGQTKICKSVLAYNTVDLAGHSVWKLTDTQALFQGRPVVASEPVYQVISRYFEVGERIPPERAAEYSDALGTRSTILTYVHTEPPGDSAAYWPIAADMIGAFLDTDSGVAIIGEGAGHVRLLLAAEDEEALLTLASLAMTGKTPM